MRAQLLCQQRLPRLPPLRKTRLYTAVVVDRESHSEDVEVVVVAAPALLSLKGALRGT